MLEFEMVKNLSVPDSIVDVVLDTDAFNEIDDQYAISYLLRSGDKLNTVAMYAAPFFGNGKSENPKDGMEKSYDEILKILTLNGREDLKKNVYKGSENFLNDETTPVISDAVNDLIDRAMQYSTDKPLYVVGIGAITNIASALILKPEIAERIVIVWLGGNAAHMTGRKEFNLNQDTLAGRIIFNYDVPLVQIPCHGVTDNLTISEADVNYWLMGKGELNTYLAEKTIAEANVYAKGRPWTRVLWDVAPIAWLLNDNDRFMTSTIIQAPIPNDDYLYSINPKGKFMRYINHVSRDNIMHDLITKLNK